MATTPSRWTGRRSTWNRSTSTTPRPTTPRRRTPNYAKATDARFQGYVELYGDDCWELDSMEPEILDLLIHDKIREHMDEAQWNAVQDRQESERSRIWDAHENWADIQEYLGNPPEEE